MRTHPRNPHQTFEHDTWLEAEEFAYPNGREVRRGRAIFPDGEVRAVYAGIPDTYFSIPAHARVRGVYVSGWVGVDDTNVPCTNLIGSEPGAALHADGALHCELCQFGLMDSPTRGALRFHISKQSQERLDAPTNERESNRA